MAPVKCHYQDCGNTNATRSVFSFPIKDEDRLKLWIQHSGNTGLTCLTHEKLKHRFICEDHFETKDVYKTSAKSRLVPWAVPLKCQVIPPQCNEKLTSYPNQKLHSKYACMDTFKNKIFNHTTNAKRTHLKPMVPDSLDGSRSPDSNNSNVRVVGNKCTECERQFHGFQWWCLQCPGARCGRCARSMAHRPHYLLRAPAHSTHEQTEALLSAIRQQLGEDVFVPQAELRHVDENGVDLRVTDEPEVKAEPPEVEDDPLMYNPAVYPLACNPKVDDPLALIPSVKDPLAFNPSEDPLECKPVLQDLTSVSHQEPSIDCQPESVSRESLQGLEPLVDQDDTGEPFKPLGVELYSPVHTGVESYEMSLTQCSGIDDFRCSGWRDSQSIDQDSSDLDDLSSDDDHCPSIKRPRVPTHYTYTGDDSDDTHSHTETDTEENQTNRPWVQMLSSQEQNIIVTKKHNTQKPRFKSTSKGQNILAKQQNIQKNRPWVQQKSEAKRKNRRSEQHIEDSISEEQYSTEQSLSEDSICEEQISIVSEKQKKHNRLERSHIEDSICEEQSHSEDFSCEEQISSVSEIQKKHNRLERSHIEDSICEELTSTVSEKQKKHNRLERAHTKYSICEEQIPTVSEKQNNDKQRNRRSEQSPIVDPLSEEQITVSGIQNRDNTLKLSEIQDSHKGQTSTVTAIRKKKFIVTTYKKRSVRKRTQYPTHIQRDLEPTDIHIDGREDAIDINMTTESSNTLLNLEDYIREKVLEYPSDIEELM